MTQLLGLLALLAAIADGGRPRPAGYHADVQVILNGTSWHGRMIVTGDGGIHLEHLDDHARRWAGAVLRRAAFPSRGWDDRIDPVRCVWCRLGPDAVLAEVHAPAASVIVARHQLFPSR